VKYSVLSSLLLWLVWGTVVRGQIVISGVSDRSTYAGPVVFTVAAEAGYGYGAWLDGDGVPVGEAVPVTLGGYHEVSVVRTNEATQAEESRLVRFIVRTPGRGSTEDGLPAHTPYPLVASAAEELAGGQLRVMAPAAMPLGMPVPVVARVETSAGLAMRVNGEVDAGAFGSIPLFRGVGSALLAAPAEAGERELTASVGGLAAHRTVSIESNTVWTAVSGSLSGAIDWPEDSRIDVAGHVVLNTGATLTIGAGSVVRVHPGVDITNNAAVVIQGTMEKPVVFAPVSPEQPWGGFTMRNSAGSVTGTGVIFTGSGADPDWYGSNGNPGSHRREQGLFFCGGDNVVALTEAAAVHLAGQLGHAVNGGEITLTRFLLQRATSGGEYTGAHFAVNDSAFIEFPEDDGVFEDGDHDCLYIIGGTHGFTNTLFGWTKDDGVDSGGSGGGNLEFRNCWFEGIFHEANSLSGVGKVVNHSHDVIVNCGQGLESGYDSPRGMLNDCLVLHTMVGGRFGDNYDDRTYAGFLTVTNSILLHNWRDVWGVTFTDWAYHPERMDVRDNLLHAPDPRWPDNAVFDPAADAARLAAFQNTAPGAPVGVGFLQRELHGDAALLAAGIPIGLSSFSTNEVAVGYLLETPGAVLASGTVVFTAGKMIQTLPPLPALPPETELARVRLLPDTHGRVTSGDSLWFVQPAGSGTLPLIAAGATWRYFDGGALPAADWAETTYDDSAWASGPAELGYGDDDEVTPVSFGGNENARYITTYFRHAFEVADAPAIGTLQFQIRRDDAAVAYLNGAEIFRSNMPDGPVEYATEAPLADDDGDTWWPISLPATGLVSGTNVVAVEIHQDNQTSSDISFDLSLEAVPVPRLRYLTFDNLPFLVWGDPAYQLEESTALDQSWNPDPHASPAPITFDAPQRFYRLRVP
jgi:hypothetical protein